MPLPNLKPTSKSVTLLIIVAAILLFSGLFVYFASSSKLKAAATELDNKQKEVENSRKIAVNLQEAEAKYMQTSAQLAYLEKSVSRQAYIPTLLKQLETLGKDVNLKVSSVRPVAMPAAPVPIRKMSTDSTNPEAAQKQADQSAQQNQQNGQQAKAVEEKPYDPLDINIEVEGNYTNTMSFLYKITSFPKIMTVNYIQLNPVAAVFGAGSPLLNVKLNLTAYVFREEDKVPPPAKDPAPVTSRLQTDWRHKNEAG